MSANERMAISDEYCSYEKYLWELMNQVHHHKLEINVIGTETSRHTGIVYPLYRFVIHPQIQKTVCLVAGIHGNEIAGPLSILHLLSAEILDLPRHYRYIVYPMINPTGFDLRQRFNADGRDLNAIYSITMKSNNYTEVEKFYEDAVRFTPFEAVITLHEDSDLEQFYMYGLGRDNLSYYHAICEFARTWIPAWTNADVYGCHSDDHGLILSNSRDHAFDGALYKKGHTKVAFTLETPGKLNIHFRVNMMTQLVLLSLDMLFARQWKVPA
jgi:predicted deacylase